jgi:hypothetical protein
MKIALPIQHDPWMINGIETLYRLVEDIGGCRARIFQDHLEIEIQDVGVFLKNLADKIRSMQDLAIFCTKLDDKGQKRYVAKDFVLIQYGKAEKRNVLKEKLYIDTEQRLTDIFSNLESGKKTCVLCGRTYKKKVDNLKQAVYPFVTKIRSLSGVRSMKDYYSNICPLCYLTGTIEWLDEGIVYRCFIGPARRTHSVVFLPFEMDLKKLNEAKKRYMDVLDGQDQQVSNVLKIITIKEEKRFIPTEGENTTALKFFEDFINKIIGELKEEQDEFNNLLDKTERVFCKQWSMLIIPSGTVKNVKYRPLVLSDETVALFVGLQREGTEVYSDIVEKLSVIGKEGRIAYDNTNNLREEAAKYIIESNFRKFSRIFLPRKKEVSFFGSITHLDMLVRFWRLRKMGLEQELENLKEAGRTLAQLLESHLSILYAMDKAKNKQEFFRAFEQASKRLIGLDAKERKKVYPVPLGNVADLIIKSDEDQWKEIRDTLIVYASVHLAKMRYVQEKETREGDSQ